MAPLLESRVGAIEHSTCLLLRPALARPGATILSELSTAALTFACLTVAAFTGLFGSALHTGPAQDDTNTTIRMVANIFVVMTSLVLGLMLNSAKNTVETYSLNVHALGTDLILLDRAMKTLGPQADTARQSLVQYVQTALREQNIAEEDQTAETLLNAVGVSLRTIQVSGDQQLAIWSDAQRLYREVVRQRWIVVDLPGGTIPQPLVVMLIVWLIAIFASFGYQAPRNLLVGSSLVVAALLVSAAVYLILDMDSPESGLVRTSNIPFQRALAEITR